VHLRGILVFATATSPLKTDTSLRLEAENSASRPAAAPPVTCLHFPGFALLWLISLNARQQFHFQPSTTLSELLNLRPKAIEKLDDLAVLLTKRVEARVCRH
jgi:hypothetical protein